MNQIVGLIMSIVYVIIYIALNIFRFKRIGEEQDFEIDSKALYTIIFWTVRVLIIAGLTCFMLFTFQEYVMFCYAKMMVLTLILSVIIFIEAESLGLIIGDGFLTLDVSVIYFTVFFIIELILILFTDMAIPGIITTDVYVDKKVEVETIYPITASDQNVVNGEINGNMFFGIHGYVEQDNLMYSYYYLSDDGKEVLYGKSDEKDTKRVLIDEGEKPYIEITTTTEQYYNVEEKERVIYDGSKNVKTTIYAPLNAYTGISFDAK